MLTGVTVIEVKTLLRDLARVWGQDVDEYYDMGGTDAYLLALIMWQLISHNHADLRTSRYSKMN